MNGYDFGLVVGVIIWFTWLWFLVVYYRGRNGNDELLAGEGYFFTCPLLSKVMPTLRF